jgi:hypothetical protein
MNALLLGTADKTSRLLELAGSHFLLIDDGPIADAFLSHFPRAKLFDPAIHNFNPLRGMDYRRARDFAETIYTASPQGQDTLTVRNGRRALTRLLLERPLSLDRLPRSQDPGAEEALAIVDDLLISPTLQRVFTGRPLFRFQGPIVAKLDRAQLGDFDAFVLASLLTQRFQGRIIIPDFGFYGRSFHVPLIRQNRLVAGVSTLSELAPTLRQQVLLIRDKEGAQCTYDDALTLALYAGLTPGETGHTAFVQERMS